MVKMSYDVVKRWVNEAQEAASSDNIMVQVDGTLHRKTSCWCVGGVCVCLGTGQKCFSSNRREAQLKLVDIACVL